MNIILSTPDVKLFVAAVRERLRDLTEEEREELVGGLEGDMSDLVAELGVDALPEPSGYARELRSAAGFAPEAAPRRTSTRRHDAVIAWMDRGTATWTQWVDSGDHIRLPAFATALRPVWWVLRGLGAAALACEIWGSQDIYGFTSSRALVAGVAVLASVVLGLWWPTSPARRSLLLRLALVVLNVFALCMLVVAYQRFFESKTWMNEAIDQTTYYEPQEGLAFNGAPVANIYPYDAAGHLLTGVQLVDRQGRRLALTQDPYNEGTGWGEFVHAPWLNGRTQLFSVFPLPEQTLDPDTLEPVGNPRLQAPPFASLPPVTFAGIRPTVVAPVPSPEAKKASNRAKQRQSREAADR
jgi:hypothetical protein